MIMLLTKIQITESHSKHVNLFPSKILIMIIKNIIFDLGGVLLNIDQHATINAFKELGVNNFDEFFTFAKQSHLFDRLDKGEISPEDFRDEIRRISGRDLDDKDIDAAWNAMLHDLPRERITLLEMAREHYRTFLLSNTNAIHYPTYTRYMKDTYGYSSLSKLFERDYLSHEVGMRKPDPGIFNFVLEENNLNPRETLFIDDTERHVEGARKTGIIGYWLDLSKDNVLDIFDNNGYVRQSIIITLENR